MEIEGTYKIQCIKPGGHTLLGYGQLVLAEGEELDLLAEGTPDTIRAMDFLTADNMCRDTGFELAQLIAEGVLVITDRQLFPDMMEP